MGGETAMRRSGVELSSVAAIEPYQGRPRERLIRCRNATTRCPAPTHGGTTLARIKKRIRAMFFGGVALCAALALQPALAQSYPSKPVKMVVPNPAGGIGDIVARAVVTKVATNLGQPIVVEARPGANGSIGTDSVAKSPADGYTWMLATLAHTTNLSMQKNLPWHPTNDFAGAAMLGDVPALAVVPASVPASSLKEFVAYAKTKPGQINYLVPGFGTSMHLNTELLKIAAGIDLVPILYKGLPQSIPDLLSGQLGFGFLSVPLALPHVNAGKLKTLAIAASKRNAQFPEVPTVAEAGFPDAQVVSWYAVVVPKKTPRQIVARINQEIEKALADPEVIKRLDNAGATVAAPMPPEALDAHLQSEVARWARFFKNVKIDSQ